MQKQPLFTRRQLIIIITSIVLGIAIIVGGVLWLTRDTSDVGSLEQTDGVPTGKPGELPWDEL